MARTIGRFKNAFNQFFIAGQSQMEPKEADWKPVAKFISNVDIDNNEDTDDFAWFDGDGTKTEEVISVARSFTFEGHRYYGDAAQDLIASIQDDIGDARSGWLKIVDPIGNQYVGRASFLDIKTTGGDASEHETFSFTARFTEKPKKGTGTAKTTETITPEA